MKLPGRELVSLLLFSLVAGCTPDWLQRSSSGGDHRLLSIDAFLKPPAVLVPALSPDGRYVSYISERSGAANIWVKDLSGGEGDVYPITAEAGSGVRAMGVAGQALYSWGADSQWIYYVTDEFDDERWQLKAVHLKTGRNVQIPATDGVTMSLLAAGRDGRAVVNFSHADPGESGLFLLDFARADKQRIAETAGFLTFFVDHNLNLRLGVKARNGGYTLYRYVNADSTQRENAAAKVWQALYRVNPQDASAFLRALEQGSAYFDSQNRYFYVSDSRGRDKTAILRVDLQAGAVTTAAADDRGDIDGVMHDHRTGEIQAYSITRARKEWVPVMPELVADFKQITGLSRGDIEIVSRSVTGNRWLLQTIESNASDRFYLYDRIEGRVERLFEDSLESTDLQLPELHAYSLLTDDGLELVSYYLLPLESDRDSNGVPESPLPAIFLIHGGPSDERATFGFSSFMHWLANRGYAVFNVNFRGSSGFGKAFLNAQNLAWGRAMNRDVTLQVEWAVERGVVDRDKVGTMGGSYGGYQTLVAMTKSPGHFACGFNFAGPSDMEQFIHEWWEVGIDVGNMAYKSAILGNPETEKGRALLRDSSPVNFAHNARDPIMIVHGARDPRVPLSHAEKMTAALNEADVPVGLVVFEEEGHGFQRGANEKAFYALVEHFFAGCLGGKKQEVGDLPGESKMIIRQGGYLIPDIAKALP